MSTPHSIPFTKMHGLGNDYVYLDDRELGAHAPTKEQAVAWASVLADRHRGIGGDGLIILRHDGETPVRMEMYNADGSRAEMCGNGIRCVARLAWERGYCDDVEFLVGSDSGPRPVRVTTDDHDSCTAVRVDMGVPVVEELETNLTVEGRTFEVSILSLGNPHCVIELEQDPAHFPVERYGPLLERHPRFPDRANIEFVHPLRRDELLFRVWERGSGETQACGTGASAAVAALHQRGRLDEKAVVHLLGGDLEIEITQDQHVWMTGPAESVFTGSFPSDRLE